MDGNVLLQQQVLYLTKQEFFLAAALRIVSSALNSTHCDNDSLVFLPFMYLLVSLQKMHTVSYTLDVLGAPRDDFLLVPSFSLSTSLPFAI